MVESGELGELLNINAAVWQNWQRSKRAGRGGRSPRWSGGGFLFDTGAHMLNTVVDIAGGPTWSRSRPGSGSTTEAPSTPGRWSSRGSASGALVTMNGCGRAFIAYRLGDLSDVRASDITDRCVGRAARDPAESGSSRLSPVRSVKSRPVWEQFLGCQKGPRTGNPSPPEVGLRMARLWDAIRELSARGGEVVRPGILGA